MSFGKSVKNESEKLKSAGKDPNQIAGILSSKDPQGANYGIGIILDGDGKPMGSSSTLIRYAEAEIRASGQGTYLNSAKTIEELTQAVLKWQRIPEQYWANFQLALPSDAGTGAVQSAVEIALVLNPKFKTLGFEELGWPAYTAIATMARLKTQEFKVTDVVKNKNILPIYQAGPMNTTGFVNRKELITERAKAANKTKMHIILDRAYSGFEYAKNLDSDSYDDVMRKSFENYIEPFIHAKVSFSLALSPTKAFVTFSLRPCGLLLTYIPSLSQEKKISLLLGMAIRARGSSFEHPVTRAFVKALINDLGGLESEHEMALRRLKDAEQMWQHLVKGTAMEPLFSEQYAGLFRNPKAKSGADIAIYNEHIYPVFSSGRCRLNVTGIPSDELRARAHVNVFSKFCTP